MGTENDPSKQEDNHIPEATANIDLTTNQGFGQLSQSRAAIVSAAVIILLTDFLGIISALFFDALETSSFPTGSQLAISVIVDVFLLIFLLLGKSWARTWMIVRAIFGLIVWSILALVQSDLAGWIITAGVLIAFIILVTGTSTRFRVTVGIVLAVVAILSGNIISIFTPFQNIPQVPPTYTIPTTYETYISEGFFSISYPPHWTPEMSVISQAEELMDEYLEDMGMDAQVGEYQLVFFGGQIVDDDNFQVVMVFVEPSSIFPLETIVEDTHVFDLENVEQYVEHSRVKTEIGGRSAVIQTCEGLDVDSCLTGYTTAYIEGEQFLWTVICSCESKYFEANLDTFDQVVRSLRVEY